MRARIGYFKLGRQREPTKRGGLQVERSRRPLCKDAAGGPRPGGGRAAPLPGALRACATPGWLLLGLQTRSRAVSQVFLIYSTHVLHLCPVTFYPRPWLISAELLEPLKIPGLLLHLLVVFHLLKGKLRKGPDLGTWGYLNICGLIKGGNLAT